MAIVYLGLGSNLGNRHANIETAVRLMAAHDITVLKISSLIETDPVGEPPQRKFLNAVAKVETHLSPKTLLKNLNSIEAELGRERSIKNGPRTIDIDILLYDQVNITSPKLTIPHPRMHERAFVLGPLNEIEPSLSQGTLR